jgi:WD40 repeat protein
MTCVAWVSDTKLVSGTDAGSIFFWEVGTTVAVQHITVGQLGINCLICVGNEIVASGDTTGSVKVWEGRYSTLKCSWKEHKGAVLSLAKDTSGMIFATGDDSKILKLDPYHGTIVGAVRGQSHTVRALAITQDGTILSGGDNMDICLYSPPDFTSSGDFTMSNDQVLFSRKKFSRISALPAVSPIASCTCPGKPGTILMLVNQRSWLDLWEV